MCDKNLNTPLYFVQSGASPPKMLLGKGVLKICRKFTGEHTCQSAISIKLLFNFFETTLWHGCSVNFLHIFRTPFYKNIYGGLYFRE